MAVREGACRFGWWFVQVAWNRNTVFRVRFSSSGEVGEVPVRITQYCSGRPVDLTVLDSPATEGDTLFARIYRAVREVGYGETATYGEISERVGTSPRAVGNAMARNPTPLVIPCHRIVARDGIGGFTPSVEIKSALIAMEKRSGRHAVD